jgi:hypothetical protein
VGRSRKRKLKVGDKVLYTIPGGRPQDVEHEWEITHTFPVVGGTMACLSRPDPEKRLKVDRCNAEIADLVLVD